MQSPVRILIVDDHALFRDSLGHVLSQEQDMEVVGCCGTVAEAVAVIGNQRVDVVLLDYDLGVERGGQFLAAAKEAGFTGRVMVVTAGVPDNEARRLVLEGVAGIFLKSKSVAGLIESIRAAAQGVTLFDERYLRLLLPGWRPVDGEHFSAREKTVIRCIVKGMTNKEIAEVVGGSETAVKATLQRIFEKSGVRSRGQLIRVALEQFRDLL